MLYEDQEKCRKNCLLNSFRVDSIFQYFPGFDNEMILELLISDTGNYCCGYENKDNLVVPIFKKEEQRNYSNDFMITVMQREALSFVKDYITLFGENTPLSCSIYDFSWPLEFYIKFAPQDDFAFLSEAYLDEARWCGVKLKIIDHRQMYVYRGGQKPELSYYSKIRALADKFLPIGTRRRSLLKRLLPKGSHRWNFLKKIYYSLGGK